MICGIYTSVEEFKKHRNTLEHLDYSYDNGRHVCYLQLEHLLYDLSSFRSV